MFSIPWHLLASALKEMEPFYQLHQPGDILASKSLPLDYKGSINAIATIHAIGKNHLLVWCSGLISLFAFVVAPLASETVFIGFVGQDCTATIKAVCGPRLSVSKMTARILQSILSIIAIFTVALTIAPARKKSGVSSNPRSISGVAALIHDKQLEEDLRRLNPYVTDKRPLVAALQGQRYKIGFWYEPNEGKCYGLMSCESISELEKRHIRKPNKNTKPLIAINPVEEKFYHRSLRMIFKNLLIHPISIVFYGLLIIGLEVIVIYYNQTVGDTPFERFMDSQGFGITFLFTAVGIVLEKYWNLLDSGEYAPSFFIPKRWTLISKLDIRAKEPYRQLLRGNAPASKSILLAPLSNPFTGLFHSLRNGHYFNAYFSLVAILCQPLIVALANIPYSPGLAYTAYQVCTYITVVILNLMLIGITWLLLCRRRTPRFAATIP